MGSNSVTSEAGQGQVLLRLPTEMTERRMGTRHGVGAEAKRGKPYVHSGCNLEAACGLPQGMSCKETKVSIFGVPGPVLGSEDMQVIKQQQQNLL